MENIYFEDEETMQSPAYKQAMSKHGSPHMHDKHSLFSQLQHLKEGGKEEEMIRVNPMDEIMMQMSP